jgi:ribosomal protein S18 acetylase RimI-like enzyme
MTIRPFHPEDEAAVIHLWMRCGLVVPQNNPRSDVERKLWVTPELFLVGTLRSKVIATVMAGYDGHRGHINYLAVAPEHQRKNYGRQIIEHAEAILRDCGCPKINLCVRSKNQSVIASIGDRLLSAPWLRLRPSRHPEQTPHSGRAVCVGG